MAIQGKIEVNQEKCKGCQLCTSVCPKNVISVDKKINSMGYYPVTASQNHLCIGCGNCYAVCPDVAITVFRTKAIANPSITIEKIPQKELCFAN